MTKTAEKISIFWYPNGQCRPKGRKKFFNKPIKPRINKEITALELRVLDAEGENLGIMTREKALELIKPEEGLDLIEISPTAKPPVARLMSFDKFRYMQDKAEKKARLAQKTAELKQVQISVRAAKNDLMIKVKQLEKFLGEGHPVDIMMRLRGREKYDKARALAKLEEFFQMITVEYRRLGEPKFGGRGMIIPIAKK